MKVNKQQFENLGITYDRGNIDISIINNVEKTLGIKFPELYIQLMSQHNDLSINRYCFLYYDHYHNEHIGTISFDGFSTNIYTLENDILRQYIYDDKVYGYPYVFSFGYTAEGNFICFDYREYPTGDDPKICIVIHDEFDGKTGKHQLYPIANSFQDFLNNLKTFEEAFEKCGIDR